MDTQHPPAGTGARPAWHHPHLDPFAADGLAAIALIGLGVTSLLAGLGVQLLPEPSAEPTALATLLVVGQTMPIAWRRRAPLGVLAVVEVCAIAYLLLRFPPTGAALGALVAFYTVAARHPTRTVLPFAGGLAAGILAMAARDRISLEVCVLLYVLFAAAWVMGAEQRARRAYTALVEDRAARLERELGYLAREAIADERARLTRELHQAVTDSLRSIVAKARAADPSLPGGGGRETLDFIEETGERTLSELRRVSAVLTPGDALIVPADRLLAMSQLSALVTEVKMAGLPIDVKVEGDAVPLPAEVDGSAYRIVQEALATCLKRQGPARPQVVIRYGDGDLELQVTDDGGPSWEVDPNGGRYENLGWMRPREVDPVVLLDRGYGLLARLPIGSARP